MIGWRVEAIDDHVNTARGLHHIAALAIIVADFPTGVPKGIRRMAADLARATKNKDCTFHFASPTSFLTSNCGIQREK